MIITCTSWRNGDFIPGSFEEWPNVDAAKWDVLQTATSDYAKEVCNWLDSGDDTTLTVDLSIKPDNGVTVVDVWEVVR